jgi:hypothetical protein
MSRGRPRKWASATERNAAKQRAYRDRKRGASAGTKGLTRTIAPAYLRRLRKQKPGNVCKHGLRLTDKKRPWDVPVCPWCGIATQPWFAKPGGSSDTYASYSVAGVVKR